MTFKSVLILLNVIVMAGLLGCFPLLSGKGSLVHVERDSGMIENCKFVGTVKGKSSMGWSKARKTENALNEVRNKAALLGANTVLMVSMDSMFKGAAVRGKAYDCPGNS